MRTGLRSLVRSIGPSRAKGHPPSSRRRTLESAPAIHGALDKRGAWCFAVLPGTNFENGLHFLLGEL